MSEEPWYKKGLRFQCTGCGKCCTGSPGYVWVSEKEIEEMASFLQITVPEFMKRYIRRVGSRYSLTEKKPNYDCVFLKDKQCSVYGARPMQCRTYPWWPQNLNSEESWREAAKTCEGISEEAEVVSCETIEEQKLIQLGKGK